MEVQFVISANKEARLLEVIIPSEFALKNPKKWNSDFLREVLNQYQILMKLVNKLPTWYQNDKIVGASLLNIEQCSSEKSSLHKFRNFKGNLAIDLTGGFGVDTYFLAKNFKKVIYVEANAYLFQIVKYNFNTLGIDNVEFVNQKAETYLAQNTLPFDLIYIDPDRRNLSNKKLVLLEECSPDLTQIQDKIFAISNQVLVKYSPLLDIQLALSKIKHVKSVEILAVKNEVKELLFHISKESNSENAEIIAINIKDDIVESFSHKIAEEKKAEAFFENPQKFLYEPNAAILKSGAFKTVGLRNALNKLAQHSHFYTSEVFRKDFPGRVFKINDVIPYNSNALKPKAKKKYNVIARNFPLNPVTICKKHHLINGGDEYLIFTQDYKNKKIILSCERIV
jgi:16S rRNA G966 N2-methylase RsmD